MKLQRPIWWIIVAAVLTLAGGPTLVGSQAALAQSWLPWTTREEPRPQRRPEPRPPPNYGQFGQPSQPRGYGNSFANRPPICLQLEQRLAQDAQRQSSSAGTVQRLNQQLQVEERKQRRAERELSRRECYETFLFTRSLRPSRVCQQLDRDARAAARQVEEITLELRQFQSGSTLDRQDEIIRALARNNCGPDYERAARQRDPLNNFWQDNDAGNRGTANVFGGLPFATYRTVCVRLCDGYYFPVSFSTLPTTFERDTEICQSKCAAPTELYFHQNPGGSVDQMISHRTQQPYTSLRTAFRYRKEFVQGCSCKADEYIPDAGTAAAQPAPASPQASKQNDKLSPVR